MSQLTHKTAQHKSKQNITCLGTAPDDIYDLEEEIAAIHSENGTNIIKGNEEEDGYQLFSTSNLSAAKQSLRNGSKIKLKLPHHPTPHQIIAIAHNIGLDTSQLHKVFANSSVVLKGIMDDYVSKTRTQYASLSTLHHPYQSTANGGYLFHCTQVDALQCEDDLSGKLRITMNLDYHKSVENDDQFQTKFVYELCNKVFKCPVHNVRVQDIRSGSIIVVIAGITLITLVTAGLLALSIKLHRRKHPSPRVDAKKKQTAGCGDGHRPLKEKRSTNAKQYKEIKHMKSEGSESQSYAQPDNLIASLFNTIKTGISSLTQPHPSLETDHVFAQLIEMGFEDQMAQNAAKKYPSDINGAVQWIAEYEHKEDDKRNEMAGAQNKENLILNINDPLWVKTKNSVWSATVVALTRDSVTIEYDNGGPYIFQKTETFALNDECLEQRQPGMQMSPSLEGCVEITKANGGFIKAWKTGLARPMADI